MGAKLSGPGGDNKYQEEANSSINVTPFVDVMLVLLIIFMVAAPLAAVTVKVELPPAVAKPGKKPSEAGLHLHPAQRAHLHPGLPVGRRHPRRRPAQATGLEAQPG
jgi:biopolymer transport protein ExbD